MNSTFKMSFASQDQLRELNILGSTITHEGTTFVLTWDSQSNSVKVILCNVEQRPPREEKKPFEQRPPREEKKPFEQRPPREEKKPFQHREKKSAEGENSRSEQQLRMMKFSFSGNEPYYVTKNFEANATKFFKKLDSIPNISDSALIIAENLPYRDGEVEIRKRIIYDPLSSKYYMEEIRSENDSTFYIYTFVHKPKDRRD